MNEDELAKFIREAGQLCEGAHRRALMAHVGNVVCLVMMGVIYVVVDGAAAARTGMISLGIMSLPVMAAEAVHRVGRWRRRRVSAR